MRSYVVWLIVVPIMLLIFAASSHAENEKYYLDQDISSSFLMAKTDYDTNDQQLSAEDIIKSYSDRAKTLRKPMGYTLLVLGPMIIASESSADTSTTNGYAVGAISMVAGLYSILYETPVEKDYARISQIMEPEEREREAYNRLIKYADDSKKNRYVFGAIELGLAGYFASKENYLGAGLFGGVSGFSFFVKSYPERDLEKYNDSDKMKAQLFTSVGSNNRINIGVRCLF